MATHDPTFCDITWGAGGTTADLTLEIASKMQNMVCHASSCIVTPTLSAYLEEALWYLRYLQCQGLYTAICTLYTELSCHKAGYLK